MIRGIGVHDCRELPDRRRVQIWTVVDYHTPILEAVNHGRLLHWLSVDTPACRFRHMGPRCRRVGIVHWSRIVNSNVPADHLRYGLPWQRSITAAAEIDEPRNYRDGKDSG